MQWEIQEAHNGMSVRDYLQDIHAFSSRLLTAIKYHGGAIRVNDQWQRTNHRLCTGDVLDVTFPPEKKGAFMIPDNIPLSIVAEDKDMIIINKAAGMATTPSPHNATGTVANGLLAYYQANNIPYTVHAVTRLDRDTTGLLLIAKHRYSHALMSTHQQAGKITRKYMAIVEGHLDKQEGTLSFPIGRKPGSIIERMVTQNGKTAITHYKVIAELPEHTFVDVELETGRTHQIRVHFAHIGHPLAGDDLYEGSTDVIQRQALHCYALHFPHPNDGTQCSFQAQLPGDMQRLVDRS